MGDSRKIPIFSWGWGASTWAILGRGTMIWDILAEERVNWGRGGGGGWPKRRNLQISDHQKLASVIL